MRGHDHRRLPAEVLRVTSQIKQKRTKGDARISLCAFFASPRSPHHPAPGFHFICQTTRKPSIIQQLLQRKLRLRAQPAALAADAHRAYSTSPYSGSRATIPNARTTPTPHAILSVPTISGPCATMRRRNASRAPRARAYMGSPAPPCIAGQRMFSSLNALFQAKASMGIRIGRRVRGNGFKQIFLIGVLQRSTIPSCTYRTAQTRQPTQRIIGIACTSLCCVSGLLNPVPLPLLRVSPPAPTILAQNIYCISVFGN